MKLPCQNLTTSRVTISDIGTKFLIKNYYSGYISRFILQDNLIYLLYLRENEDPRSRVLNELKAPV